MSLDVPYERLGAQTKVDYIPLKLALNDLPDANNGSDDNDVDPKKDMAPKIDINVRPFNDEDSIGGSSKQQMYDALVLGMLTFFCVLVLLYAVYYFVILRDRQKSIIQPNYMF